MNLYRITSLGRGNQSRGQLLNVMPIDENGDVTQTPAELVHTGHGQQMRVPRLVLAVPHWLVATPFVEGQWVSVTEYSSEVLAHKHEDLTVRYVKTIKVSHIEVVVPSGELFIKYIGSQKRIPHFDEVKARTLWNLYQESIFDILDNKDRKKLLAARLSEKMVNNLLSTWETDRVGESLKFLLGSGLSHQNALNCVRYYGAQTRQKLEADPYRILPFFIGQRDRDGADALGRSGIHRAWSKLDRWVMSTASRFGVKKDDPRRIRSCIEDYLYEKLGETKSTVCRLIGDGDKRSQDVRSIIASRCDVPVARVDEVLASNSIENNFLVCRVSKKIQLKGEFYFEEYVAKRIAALIKDQPEGNVENALAYAIEQCPFKLTDSQAEAVALCLLSRFSMIKGGAGTGKTTVLQTVLTAVAGMGYDIVQGALAGLASLRMEESTKRDSYTIAGLLRGQADEALSGEKVCLVLDECSMIDLHSFARVMKKLESIEDLRIILVGDPAQLPPIGAGLVFHFLAGRKEIPQSELKEVQRYSGSILENASKIRAGKTDLTWDKDFQKFELTKPKAELPELVEMFLDNELNTQIVCDTKKGTLGANELNKLIREGMDSDVSYIRYPSRLQAGLYEHEDFRVGDRILCNKNRHDLGLRNGSIGTITEVYDADDIDMLAEDPALAKVSWADGVERELTISLLNDIEHGFAITTHKSQGSGFFHTIFCCNNSRLADRSLIYTAITRSKKKCTFVSVDMHKSLARIAAPPADLSIEHGLGDRLYEEFHLF